jgi:hypothetical protein
VQREFEKHAPVASRAILSETVGVGLVVVTDVVVTDEDFEKANVQVHAPYERVEFHLPELSSSSVVQKGNTHE